MEQVIQVVNYDSLHIMTFPFERALKISNSSCLLCVSCLPAIIIDAAPPQARREMCCFKVFGQFDKLQCESTEIYDVLAKNCLISSKN